MEVDVEMVKVVEVDEELGAGTSSRRCLVLTIPNKRSMLILATADFVSSSTPARVSIGKE